MGNHVVEDQVRRRIEPPSSADDADLRSSKEQLLLIVWNVIRSGLLADLTGVKASRRRDRAGYARRMTVRIDVARMVASRRVVAMEPQYETAVLRGRTWHAGDLAVKPRNGIVRIVGHKRVGTADMIVIEPVRVFAPLDNLTQFPVQSADLHLIPMMSRPEAAEVLRGRVRCPRMVT